MYEADEYPVEPDTAPLTPIADNSVDLDSDPFADDLSKELAHAAPKVWFNRTTVVVGALVLIVGGFLGGIQVQKHYGSSSSSTGTSAADLARARAAFTGRGGEGGFGGGGFGGGAGTGTGTGTATGTGAAAAAASSTGKITLVDGTTIYVTLTDGTVLTVKTTGTTKVTTSTTAKVSALTAGETVTIGGTPDANGNVTATSVTAAK